MTYQWVSVEEAARRLGISVSTVRRRIEAGDLVGEREVIGGSKERYRVRVETQQEAPDEASAVQVTRTTADASDSHHDAPAITERALAILDTVLRANAETIDKQAARIDQYSEMLRQEQERRIKAEVRADHLAEEAARLRAEAARPWWKRLW